MKAAILAQEFVYGLITTSVTGTVGVLFLLLLELCPAYRNSRLKMLWIKCTVLFFLVPTAAMLVIGSRTFVGSQGIAWSSDFWRTATPPMQKAYLSIVRIVLSGLAVGIIFRIYQYCILRNILKGNIPVEHELCKKIIKEYQREYNLKNVRFYQNDLLEHPICAGIRSPMVILPIGDFKERELHMILEHELTHIRRKDLLWKQICLLVTFLHWWNPFAYCLLKMLIFQEEIECDIITCENSGRFAKREYLYYLTGLKESEEEMIFATALSKSRNNIVRRVEGMTRRKKYTKEMAVISCLLLSLLAVLPSYAAAEGAARFNERWLAETEIEHEVEQVDYEALQSYSTVEEEAGVQEIDLTLEEGVNPAGTTVSLNKTIAANTRVLYTWQQMSVGDVVAVFANCSDSSIVYRIGIRDADGNLTYVQGSGTLNHVFTISTAGRYAVYVQNTSTSKSMQVTGEAVYPEY